MLGRVPIFVNRTTGGKRYSIRIWNGAGWLSVDSIAGYKWYQEVMEAGVGTIEYSKPVHPLQAPMVGLVESLMPDGWS